MLFIFLLFILKKIIDTKEVEKNTMKMVCVPITQISLMLTSYIAIVYHQNRKLTMLTTDFTQVSPVYE